MPSQLHKALSIFLILLVSFSCKKEKNNSNVPGTLVDIYLYPNDPQYATTIGVVSGWVYINGATKGIIVYRLTNTDFVAYDRCCTWDPNTNAALKVQSDNVTVRDTVCGSKFSIVNGSVTQGPAAQAMKAYATTYDGNVLHIYN